MSTLFFKIFFCFVVIIILVGTSLETSTLLARYYEDRWQRVLHSIMPMEAERAAEMFEASGKETVKKYLDDLQSKKTVRFYLFDEYGEPLLDRNAPEVVQRMARNHENMLRTAKENLSAVNVRQAIALRLVSGPSGRKYILAFQMSPSHLLPLSEKIGGHPYLRLLAVFLFGLVLCFFLTRHITKPLVHLRAATDNLAQGHLKTRVGPSLRWRHDEISALGRDFDRMADQIETLVTAQRNLLGDVSHELRSPLARLIVALSLLRQCPGEEAIEYQNRIALEADRLDKMIGQLLTLTRIDSGMDASRRETFDLTALVHEVAADADFEGRAHDRQVKVLSAEACQMSGVSELVRSAVENIVRNAVRHTPAGTAVEVTLSRENVSPQTRSSMLNRMEELQTSVARLRVRDYGPGVHPQLLQKIFLPFHRVQTSTPYQSVVVTTTAETQNNGSKKGLPTAGAGLGLAIADRVVRMHHGSIEAYNALDGGLIIDVRFPLI